MVLLPAVAGTGPGLAHAEEEFKGAVSSLALRADVTRGFKHLMATATLWRPGAAA